MCSMQAIIEEMRTGQPYDLPEAGIVQPKLAAGPTTIEDLVRHSTLLRRGLSHGVEALDNHQAMLQVV